MKTGLPHFLCLIDSETSFAMLCWLELAAWALWPWQRDVICYLLSFTQPLAVRPVTISVARTASYRFSSCASSLSRCLMYSHNQGSSLPWWNGAKIFTSKPNVPSFQRYPTRKPVARKWVSAVLEQILQLPSCNLSFLVWCSADKLVRNKDLDLSCARQEPVISCSVRRLAPDVSFVFEKVVRLWSLFQSFIPEIKRNRYFSNWTKKSWNVLTEKLSDFLV